MAGIEQTNTRSGGRELQQICSSQGFPVIQRRQQLIIEELFKQCTQSLIPLEAVVWLRFYFECLFEPSKSLIVAIYCVLLALEATSTLMSFHDKTLAIFSPTTSHPNSFFLLYKELAWSLLIPV